MGFIPSRSDQYLWWIQSKDHTAYDYSSPHVDDIMVASKHPAKYISVIEKHFSLRNIEHNPTYYLGNDITNPNGFLHLSCSKYIKEILERYQLQHGSIRKFNSPMDDKDHPEMDTSPKLNYEGHQHYHQLIGTAQCLVTAGQFDIQYTISSLSRFVAPAMEVHLKMAQRMFGYLKKFPRRGYVIIPIPLRIDKYLVHVSIDSDFGNQYSYFREMIDPMFPEPKISGIELNLFCYSDHAHDKCTRRSITGIIGFLASTLIIWLSKRQASVQTSTYGEEIVALKRGVEVVEELRYHLHSMGVQVDIPTNIFEDNASVCISSSDPGSSLNKKNVELSYHYIRENVANKVVKVLKIYSLDNYADPFTKALPARHHGDIFYNLLSN